MEKLKTIKNMLRNSGLSTEEIAMFTGYAQEDVLLVQKQLQENPEEDMMIRKTSQRRR